MNQSVLNRARIDKFNLILDLPNAIKQSVDPIIKDKFKADTIQFSVYGSPVPKIQIPEIKLPYGGQNAYVSSHTRPAYPPLTLSYLIDNGYQNYWILWKWLNLFNDQNLSTSDISNPPEGYNIWHHYSDSATPLSDYQSSFCLYALDEFNNPIVAFKYSNAFITGLSELNYLHQDAKEITGTVTFAYDQLTVDLLNNVNDII
jgi:hypothetical protein